jgi:exocyst complex component 3
VCRRIVLDDLRVAKSGVVPCFPPEYQIYDRFVGFYHNCLSRRVNAL